MTGDRLRITALMTNRTNNDRWVRFLFVPSQERRASDGTVAPDQTATAHRPVHPSVPRLGSSFELEPLVSRGAVLHIECGVAIDS